MSGSSSRGALRVVVGEPQCRGFEHATFNAALVRTVQHAFPDAEVVYLGELEHNDWVGRALAQSGAAPALRFGRLPVPEGRRAAPEGFSWRSLQREHTCARELARAVARERADLVVLASITVAGLAELKARLLAGSWRPPTIVIPHGALAALHPDPRWRPSEGRLLKLRRVLAGSQPRRLRFVALGDPVQHALAEAHPALARRFSPLEPPYLWPAGSDASVEAKPEVVRFGYLGVSVKGIDTFARVAAEVRRTHPRAEFLLVGFLSAPLPSHVDPSALTGLGDCPLPAAEFERRARSLTYALWTARPEDYRLRASASFLDAVAFAKPGLYLDGPYVQHYFARLGDIGYRCESPEHMVTVARQILDRFPAERYAEQRRSLLEGRRIFEPEALAPRLRAIAAECGLGAF